MSNTMEQTELSSNNNVPIITPDIPHIQDTFIKKINEKEVNDLMKKLEAEGEKKLAKFQSTNTLTVSNLTDIMEDGFAEFRAKTGRNPTYGEMRAMYG
jgi:hypothetical protein